MRLALQKARILAVAEEVFTTLLNRSIAHPLQRKRVRI